MTLPKSPSICNPPDYHCFDIKCQWITHCLQKNCYLWRIQRAGAWYMCQTNPIADEMYEEWGEANMPCVRMGIGSGGPHFTCFSAILGTEKENDKLDEEVKVMIDEIKKEQQRGRE